MQMREEIPSRLERELKNIDKRDEEVVKQNKTQMQMNNEHLAVLKDGMNSQLEISNDRIISMVSK